MSDLNKTTKELKAELDKSLGLLRTLHDEVKVKVHLAGMSAKDQWRDLEPRLHAAVESAAKEVSEASRKAVTDATEALKKFKASISS
jgi:transposase